MAMCYLVKNFFGILMGIVNWDSGKNVFLGIGADT